MRLKTTKRILKSIVFLFILMNFVAYFHAYKFTHFATSIDLIYTNLNNKKVLKTYPEAGHDNYLKQYKNEWTNDISAFLLDNNTPQ